MGGEFETRVADGASDAVAALTNPDVRETDQREPRHPERHIHFDVDRTGIDAEHGRRP
jgi:hypothetical protein